MVKLSGSLFVRNAIKLDYCVKESIGSISHMCDEVVVLDCQSDDGTTELLHDYCGLLPNVRYMNNGNWKCAKDYTKLRMLANACINECKGEWHFMIQADEVIHEKSIPVVRKLVEKGGPKDLSYAVRRYNLFGSVDKHISLNLQLKPCSDRPTRLARRHIKAGGDAESLVAPNPNTQYIDEIVLFHYGYVREDKKNVDKAVEMQSWFFGDKGRVDGRLLEMQERGVWEPEKLIPPEHLTDIPMPHPKYSKGWADARRK